MFDLRSLEGSGGKRMITYPEILEFQEASKKLLEAKLFLEFKYCQAMAKLETKDLSPEDYDKACLQIMENYDRAITPAEQEYDKIMDRIRTWKKERRNLRGE